MSRKLLCLLAALLLVGVTKAPIAAAQSTIGDIVIDTPTTGTGFEFDIQNYTGANDFLSPDANPVTTSVNLTDLNLVFGSNSEGPSYFTLDADGISEDGSPLTLSLTGIDSATLTGEFSTTTLDLTTGPPETVEDSFTATITDPSGLKDGDLALIITTPASTGPSPVPEPEPLIMVGTALTALAGIRRRLLMASIRRFSSRLAGLAVVLAFAGVYLLTPVNAQAQVKLGTWTVPSSGLAGYNNVTSTGAGYPSGTLTGVTVSFATGSCGGTIVATEAPIAMTKIVGSDYRAEFLIPASLTTGNYFVSIAGSSPSFSSSTCSEVSVTATSTTLAACVPTSSLAVVAGTNVNAFVPNGYWESGSTGIQEVPIEGTGTRQTFTTAGGVNSCAANSATGEVICTENGTSVDLINGGVLTTLTSGATATTGFSGGSCTNCGVGVNAANNTAVIEEGISSATSGSGVQVLNLSNNTFNTPFGLFYEVSEDISIDPGRNLILSPSERGIYDLLQVGAGNALTEYTQDIGGTLDSAAEDCTTGIAMASDEFTDDIYITDLTQATFTAGSPGTWAAPGQFLNLNDGGYSAGTCGISTAPGTGHLAVVTGEFGGSAFSALQLPSTSGSGTPTLADYAYASQMPLLPGGASFSAGFDPHTVTAYTSPNTNKSYAVFADYSGGVPAYLGVVDLACTLALPRDAGTHNITNPGIALTSCVNYISIH